MNRQSPGLRLAAVVAGVLALITLLFVVAEKRTTPAPAATDLLVPVSNPPLEPDRPDLIGEPRIDKPQGR